MTRTVYQALKHAEMDTDVGAGSGGGDLDDDRGAGGAGDEGEDGLEGGGAQGQGTRQDGHQDPQVC